MDNTSKNCLQVGARNVWHLQTLPQDARGYIILVGKSALVGMHRRCISPSRTLSKSVTSKGRLLVIAACSQ